MALIVQTVVFSIVTPCTIVGGYQHFEQHTASILRVNSDDTNLKVYRNCICDVSNQFNMFSV
jgi:hypothetical protein